MGCVPSKNFTRQTAEEDCISKLQNEDKNTQKLKVRVNSHMRANRIQKWLRFKSDLKVIYEHPKENDISF